ncbi:serine O-acetyltransferase [Rodentibacter pneumotropicus]|uniref:Serine acetyltransferase n=1 Tax=Rodentibacter pneumotropicus TaxID=758 RepID=A0A4S2PQB8_9PAST|nr:serine acetyltransferase [Rodentibacter pneumotropicus]THA05923.1 serine acetyltransferase [Rodentibacter pneumotropicus]
MSIGNDIRRIIISSINEIHNEKFIADVYKNLDIDNLENKILDDLNSYTQRDPASKNNPIYQYNKYQYALFLSSKGKLLSGAEINPYARIGDRFVLDHGIGTVIGETAEIGDDAYILGGVILGAKGISSNPREPRHPKIGNNVRIGSFAKLFGKINIGNNVFIGSNCTITEDIPDNHIVTVKTKHQIIRSIK